MQAGRLSQFRVLEDLPKLDVFEDETTVPRRKKRRSSAARRVSFAETQTVHVIPRDDEYTTPPGAAKEVVPRRRSPRLAGKRRLSKERSEAPSFLEGDIDTGSSTEKDAVAFASSDAGDEEVGPVDINHIRQANHSSPYLEDDITLDSTSFSAKFSIVEHNPDEEPEKGNDNFSFKTVVRNDDNRTAALQRKDKSPWTSDMSFTEQRPRRPAISTGISPSASVDKCMTMQYTEMVDAATMAQRRRRVFRVSPCTKNVSPLDSENIVPKKLRLSSIEKVKSPFRRPLQEISSSFQKRLAEVSDEQIESDNRSVPRRPEEAVDESIEEVLPMQNNRVTPNLDFFLDAHADDSQADITGRTSPVPTLGLLLDRDTTATIAMDESTSFTQLGKAVHDATKTTPVPSLRFLLDRDATMHDETRTASVPRVIQTEELSRTSPVPSLASLLNKNATLIQTPELSNDNADTDDSSMEQVELVCPERKISVAEFLELADVKYPVSSAKSVPDPRFQVNRASSSPFETLKFVCLTNPLAGVLRDGKIQLQSALRTVKTSIAEVDSHLSECNPSIFGFIQTVKGQELSELQRRLKSKFEKIRDENLDWMQLELDFEKEKDACLRTNETVLVGEAEAFGCCYKSLQDISDRCSELQKRMFERNKSQEKEFLDRKKRLITLRTENEDLHEKVRRLKEKVEALNSSIQGHASLSMTSRKEQRKACLLQKLQGWHLSMFSRKQSFEVLEGTYAYRIKQSITIEGTGPAKSAWIKLSPNMEAIEKGFPHIHAPLLFEALLPPRKVKVKQLKSLPVALERTSDLVTTLSHVAKEAGECRVEYRCIDSVVFYNDPETGICLRLSFENYRMRLKVSLEFQLKSLASGEYPKNILPFDIQVEFQKRTQNMITVQDLKKAISSLQPGYRRFHRICTCVSSFFL